jgi:glycosyltransferase involved in cell wall biosynthesis
MRIAYFSDTFWPDVNGVAMTLRRLVEHLERRNISFRVFAPASTEQKRLDYVFTDQLQHIQHIQRAASLPFFLYPECRIALPNYLSVHSQLERFKPDLIHIATPFNMGLCGLYYARKYGIPHVASYHTHFDRYLSYYHLQFAASLLWRYIRWFHRSCLATFVPSVETADQLAVQGIQGIELWKRGVDCQLFHPARKSEAIREKYRFNERYVLLYVGRLAPEKDLDIVLEAMAKFPEALKPHVRWIFVGEGPMQGELKAEGFSNVTCTGYLGGEELAEMYASADVFVFPSSTETFGNVALESLASGTPVIGVRAGGVQEIVQHEQTGLLCPPRDADALLDAIVGLLEQPERIHTYGIQGREYALSQSWEAIFDNLLLKYEQLAEPASAIGRRNPFSA